MSLQVCLYLSVYESLSLYVYVSKRVCGCHSVYLTIFVPRTQCVCLSQCVGLSVCVLLLSVDVCLTVCVSLSVCVSVCLHSVMFVCLPLCVFLYVCLSHCVSASALCVSF